MTSQLKTLEQTAVPQSSEVDQEEIDRLIRDVILQKPAKLHFPKAEK